MLTVEVKWHKSNPIDPDPRTVISEARPAVVRGVHRRAAQPRRHRAPARQPQPPPRRTAPVPEPTAVTVHTRCHTAAMGLLQSGADTSVIASG